MKLRAKRRKAKEFRLPIETGEKVYGTLAQPAPGVVKNEVVRDVHTPMMRKIEVRSKRRWNHFEAE